MRNWILILPCFMPEVITCELEFAKLMKNFRNLSKKARQCLSECGLQ